MIWELWRCDVQYPTGYQQPACACDWSTYIEPGSKPPPCGAVKSHGAERMVFEGDYELEEVS